MCNDNWGLGQEIETILVLALRLNYASSRMHCTGGIQKVHSGTCT